MQSGALASRFGKPIYFNRPSRGQLEMILQREVESYDGNFAWIAPTLNYCEKIKETDPRQVISLCISGGDDWLTDNGSGMSVMEKILNDTSKGGGSEEDDYTYNVEDIDWGDDE